MSKHRLYDFWHYIKNLSLILLIGIFIVSVGTSIYALRANNLKMVQLKQAVFKADQQNSDVSQALNNLRQFVYKHMNTSLTASSNSDAPPIQLVNSYNRAVKAAETAAANSSAANKVYATAEQSCLAQSNSSPSLDIAQCIQSYITAHSNEIPQLKLPPKEAYMFSFVSPIWSPDLAGGALVISVIIGLILLIRLISELLLKKYLKS